MVEKRSEELRPAWLDNNANSDDLEPMRYRHLRRNMIVLMMLTTVVPLTLMALINHHQYQRALQSEIMQPMLTLVGKTRHSFELFLTERLSAVSFIASAYSYQDLADQKTLNRIFRIMQEEFAGFVDLGLIDGSGLQITYSGPYNLKDKKYGDHDWFNEVMVRGEHISDVFMGHRKFPHFVIAVRNVDADGNPWILRATIDTATFNHLIESMGLDPRCDALIVNRGGICQTSSRFYGKVLETFPMAMPPKSHDPNIVETQDPKGREILMAYTDFNTPAFTLILIKPKSDVLRSVFALKNEILVIFLASVTLLFLVIFKLTDTLVRRIEESDTRRQLIYRQMEHTNRLSSIGRLAAGVAHEINNPMAIINEKGGLMEDLIAASGDFPHREKFLKLTQSITGSVQRCATITHRLLGFARRMDVQIEPVDVNEVVGEVLGFLEKEALYRNIEIQQDLDSRLPQIQSDHGQLQQVLLNILNNAFSAVADHGRISITSRIQDAEFIAVDIRDNGVGMSSETLRHIFDPFYSTRQGKGTGLGLSISYGIVHKLGGRIEVNSEEGVGTVFTLLVPRTSKLGGKS